MNLSSSESFTSPRHFHPRDKYVMIRNTYIQNKSLDSNACCIDQTHKGPYKNDVDNWDVSKVVQNCERIVLKIADMDECQTSGKIADVVYGWSLKIPRLLTHSSLATFTTNSLGTDWKGFQSHRLWNEWQLHDTLWLLPRGGKVFSLTDHWF